MSLALGVAMLLAGSMPAEAKPRPERVEDCEARARDGEPYDCYQKLVRSRPGAWAGVSRRLRTRLRHNPRDVTARLGLGMVSGDRGDPAAESLLRTSAAEMRASGDAKGEASAWRALLPLLLRQRRHAEAKEAVAAHRRAVEASGDPHFKTAAQVLDARLALDRTAFDAAWRLLKETEPAVFPDGPVWLQSDALSAMGYALWGLGRHDEALEIYRRLLDLVRQEGDRYLEADALYGFSLIKSRLAGAFSPEVVALEERALQVAIESGNASAEVGARMALAQEPGHSPAARIEQIERALVVLRRTGDVGQACFALRELARALDNMGRTDRAFQAADEAVRRARDGGDRFHLARGLLRRWNLAVDHWPRERAVAAGLDALDAIEAIRDLQRDEDARARVSSEWVFVYQQVIGFLLTPARGSPTDDDVDRALGVSERLRARELLGALDAAGSTAVLAEARPQHAVREAVLRQIAQAQQRLLNAGLEDEGRRQRLTELERLEVRERSLRDQLAAADPAFGSLRRPRLATLAELQAALAPEQALIAFVLCQRPSQSRWKLEHPWAFVVTREAGRSVSLPEEAADPQLSVAGLAGLVGRRDGSEAAGAGRLYALLMKEALDRLPPSVRRLVIVPDAALHRIPFDALRPEASARLAERYEMTVAPSASLWLHLRHRPPVTSGALLALADPHWEGPSGVAIERQAALWQGLTLGRLPRGRSEARRALRSFDSPGRLLLGEEATERFLKTADLRPYAIIHFAAHAVIDDDSPARSAIVLAPGAKEEDGLLQSREIVGLDLSGLVVVLSACRSSSGEVLAGEGPLSLARAFLQAGVRAVVGNLWEVRDDEAEELMAAFYRHLGQGRSVASALAAARRERLRAGATTAAWAGTVVLGDGDAVIASGGGAGRSHALVWVASLLMAALLLGVLAFRWRRGGPGPTGQP